MGIGQERAEVEILVTFFNDALLGLLSCNDNKLHRLLQMKPLALQEGTPENS